ncbi:hypothetical protein GCM10011352_34930 [Marinobacterium zhoushanense]|uniref:Uncharacterized protein n=1 Tax=Marinobacterium zhoushanense TaxID=1679163 RepID=A0ABQ1KRP7_9GAMM|nr:hypothetical protein [Marinobacterium zhoushanense]GGC05757.1 hypothetical protein GCM10011352_34930 [Marinobacterium zhoushanense]
MQGIRANSIQRRTMALHIAAVIASQRFGWLHIFNYLTKKRLSPTVNSRVVGWCAYHHPRVIPFCLGEVEQKFLFAGRTTFQKD